VTPRVKSSRAQSTTDAQLLAAVAEGDLAALGEIYDRHAADVWRAVRRALGDACDAEDVVHAAFVALPRLAASYDGRPSCRSWLCGIGVHLALRHRRSAFRFRRMLESLAHTVVRRATTETPSPELAASHGETLVTLERALEALSHKKRAVFVLVEMEGLSAEEAARALGIPAATARTRLFHARRELQEALEEGEVP
jgi:RNA polymerase sigma-70 factor, ECF subfamily